MGIIRRIWDRIVLSDHEWKKKNCPYLYNYLARRNIPQIIKDIQGMVESSGYVQGIIHRLIGKKSEKTGKES